jgi:hypothetical protein
MPEDAGEDHQQEDRENERKEPRARIPPRRDQRIASLVNEQSKGPTGSRRRPVGVDAPEPSVSARRAV